MTSRARVFSLVVLVEHGLFVPILGPALSFRIHIGSNTVYSLFISRCLNLANIETIFGSNYHPEEIYRWQGRISRKVNACSLLQRGVPYISIASNEKPDQSERLNVHWMMLLKFQIYFQYNCMQIVSSQTNFVNFKYNIVSTH